MSMIQVQSCANYMFPCLSHPLLSVLFLAAIGSPHITISLSSAVHSNLPSSPCPTILPFYNAIPILFSSHIHFSNTAPKSSTDFNWQAPLAPTPPPFAPHCTPTKPPPNPAQTTISATSTQITLMPRVLPSPPSSPPQLQPWSSFQTPQRASTPFCAACTSLPAT